jgi:hypothetical protein
MLVVKLNVGDKDIPWWCRETADCSATLHLSSESSDEVWTDTVIIYVRLIAEDNYG